MNTPLNIVPAPLLRLILCGGGGLAPAYGPLTGPESGTCEPRRYVYDGVDDIALAPEDDESAHWMSRDDEWLMPLNAKSPWPARLALVAAWIVSNQTPFTAWFVPAADEGERGDADPELRWVIRSRVMQCSWSAEDGRCWISNAPHWPDLPTLPQHLQTHSPAVALLLALYDVPEIRARVESV